MFYPQEMTEIEIIVPERDMLAVTKMLADQGIFQEIDTSYLSSKTEPKPAVDWQERATAYGTLERRITALMQALSIDEGTPALADQASLVEIEAIRPTVDRVERDAQMVLDNLAAQQKKLDQLQGHLDQLEIIADLDVDVNILRNPHFIFSMLGIIPQDNLSRLHTSLARIPHVLLTLHQDNQRAVVWLLGTQQNADILQRAARSAYLNPLELPETYQGTPAQIIEAIQADIKQTQRHVAEQKGTLTELGETHKQLLKKLLWGTRASRMLADAITHFGRLRYTYLIVGWVPSSSLDNLAQRLKEVSADTLIEANRAKRGGAEQNVPVALDNPGILHAFQQLVTTYARPSYAEVDPTLLIMVTFPLLYGAMFGDVGHGLVLALLGGLLASRKIKALRGMTDLGVIITVCGLVAAGFGVLYGSVFGLENLLPALWMRPMKNIMQILIITVGFGVVLLSIGFLTGIFNAWRAHDWGRLLFDHNGIAGLVLYWSLIGLAASFFIKPFPVRPVVFVVLMAITGVAVMFSEMLSRLIKGQHPLVEGGIGTYAVVASFELIETLISFLSNSLSYVRVGAFAVAHGGLSAVVFILADMVGPTGSIGYWIVLALGNLFIVGFEGLIVGIQSLRLEYYEFFSKFFMGGGAHYKPLAIVPQAGE